MGAIFLRPLQRNAVKPRVEALCSNVREWPGRGQRYEGTQAHVRNMGGEIIQSIKDLSRV